MTKQKQLEILHKVARPTLIRRIKLHRSRLRFFNSLNNLDDKQIAEKNMITKEVEVFKELLELYPHYKDYSYYE